MEKGKYGTFDDLMEITAAELRPIATALRQVIIEIDSETVEVVRLGDRAATYGVGPKKMSEGYVYILPYQSWVNLGFYKGVALSDPGGILEGTGKSLRHVKIRTADDVADPRIRALVEEAMAERKSHFGIS